MGKYDFDRIVDRKNTSCIKYDFALERMGRDDLIPLWVADMDFALPEEITEELVKRARHGIFGYTDPKEDYKNALNHWFSTRHGFTIEDEWNTVTAGVVFAIATAVRALTKEGDAILIQQPVYYPFLETIKLNNRKPVNNALVYSDGRYSIDLQDFEDKIVSENVKLFILCSPHNPVGRVWTAEELNAMAEICYRHNVYVFSDEIHFDFTYKGHKHISYMNLDEKYRDKLILGTSLGKTFNIPGLSIANTIIPNEEVREAFRNELYAIGYAQCNVMGLTATIAAYEKGAEWLDELLEYLEGNVSFVRDYLKEKLPMIKLVEPEGTYLIWLDFSQVTQDRKELEHIIVDKARLWLDPGIVFGEDGALFERVNIACPRQILKDAMDRLYAAITR